MDIPSRGFFSRDVFAIDGSRGRAESKRYHGAWRRADQEMLAAGVLHEEGELTREK